MSMYSMQTMRSLRSMHRSDSSVTERKLPPGTWKRVFRFALPYRLDVFTRAGMPRLVEKSRRLTAYLDWLIRARLHDTLDIVTPNDPKQRGAQLSVRVRAGRDAGRSLFEYLEQHGVIGTTIIANATSSPSACSNGTTANCSAVPSAKVFPIKESSRQVAMFERPAAFNALLAEFLED